MFFAGGSVLPFPVLLLLILFLVVTACSDPEEYARFEATTLVELPQCVGEPFPMEFTLLSARQRIGTVGIFLETPPDLKSRHDLVYLELYNPEEVQLGEDILLSPSSSVARGKLTFFSSCPYENQSYQLEGVLRFSSFDYQENLGMITGELLDGRAIDSHSGEVVFDDLHGSWRFALRRGPPYQEFFALPERPSPGDP